VDIVWAYTARAGGIVSLLGKSVEYEGGAHPIELFDTYIARESGEKLAIDDMMVLKRSPSPAMIVAMCEALKAEKKKRIGAETIFDEPIVCAGAKANVKPEKAKLLLAPSNQPGKFGGVYAYFEAYEVGAYVEGPYGLTIQQSIFAEDLKPEFKALFGGEATSPPD
jgi:hypothetical protein